jgi:hypothetical protein
MAVVKRQQVFCTTRFVGFHFWSKAPDAVAYLREPHRHEFHVNVVVVVKHGDRDKEFITLRRALDVFIHNRKALLPADAANALVGPLANSYETAYPLSCEMLADIIGQYLSCSYRVQSVSVSEDGENGGKVIYDLDDN